MVNPSVFKIVIQNVVQREHIFIDVKLLSKRCEFFVKKQN